MIPGPERDFFDYKQGELYCENVSFSSIARKVPTPFFVYSRAALENSFNSIRSAFGELDILVCFAVKSNSNLAVIKTLGDLGAGMDIVSGGELYRVLKAGVPADRVVFSGVGKTEAEIRYALDAGIHSFNVESKAELDELDRIAGEIGITAPVSIRVNPDVESYTHHYTSTGKKETKFGVPIDEAREIYKNIEKYANIRARGLDCHIGSQITGTEPFLNAAGKMTDLFKELVSSGVELDSFDFGGGLGIRYNEEVPPSPQQYAESLLPLLKPLNCKILLEPGRYISGNAGALATKVVYCKKNAIKNFAIVDAGMNDIVRPSLYGSYQHILPVKETSREKLVTDVVGPICETGDYLALGRELPEFRKGELMAVMSAGAYGFVMSSNYNSRPRAAEVLVDGSSFRVVRKHETYEDLIRGEEI